MNSLKLPIYPNKLLENLDDDNLLDNVILKTNAKTKYITLQRENNNLSFDNKYNPSQSSSNLYKIHLQNTFRLIKSFLEEQGLNSANCVDVGCGKGEFVNLLNEDSFFNCIGFDTSYEGKNNKIQRRYLNENDYDPQINLVILKYVLDYIYPPNKFLEFLKKIFPNAYIFIEGPYIEDSIINNRFYDICYEQINYFSKESYLNFFNNKILKSGFTFGNQYFFLISHLKFYNKNSDIDYQAKNLKKINIENIFPNMKVQLTSLKKIYDESEILWFWGAARKTVMCIYHFFYNYEKELNLNNFRCIDQNTSKSGKYLPGTKIKVTTPERIIKKIKINDRIIISNPFYENEIKNYLNSKLEFDIKIIILK